MFINKNSIISCLQVVPHITDAIKEKIQSVAVVAVDGKEGPPDVCVIELGGTVGETDLLVTILCYPNC